MHTKFGDIIFKGGATSDTWSYLQIYLIQNSKMWCTYAWPHLLKGQLAQQNGHKMANQISALNISN